MYLGTCSACGKQAYGNRKTARAAIRRAPFAGTGMREYRCPDFPFGWHIGHLPSAARRGVRAAGDAARANRRRGPSPASSNEAEGAA